MFSVFSIALPRRKEVTRLLNHVQGRGVAPWNRALSRGLGGPAGEILT